MLGKICQPHPFLKQNINQFLVLIDASCVVDDIEVVFYEIDPNLFGTSWEARGIFAPKDVHRQVQFFFGKNNNLKSISVIYVKP